MDEGWLAAGLFFLDERPKPRNVLKNDMTYVLMTHSLTGKNRAGDCTDVMDNVQVAVKSSRLEKLPAKLKATPAEGGFRRSSRVTITPPIPSY